VNLHTDRAPLIGSKRLPKRDAELLESAARLIELVQPNPLLVSVRSGAKFSMPGMMDTVLNLGLNEETLGGLVALTGNERFGWDAYRRFVQMFGRIVLGVEGESFEEAIQAASRISPATMKSHR